MNGVHEYSSSTKKKQKRESSLPQYPKTKTDLPGQKLYDDLNTNQPELLPVYQKKLCDKCIKESYPNDSLEFITQ